MNDEGQEGHAENKPAIVEEAFDAAKDIGAAAATSAAKGAAVAGVAGAAAGAVKGAGVATLKNKTVRKWAIVATAGLLAVAMVTFASIAMGVASLASALGSAPEQNAEHLIEKDGMPAELVQRAGEVSAKFGIPRELVLAILESKPDFDFAPFVAHLNDNDPQRQWRDMRSGAVSDSSSVAMHIPRQGPAADAASRVRLLYTSALQDSGYSLTQASSVYQKALRWVLGGDRGECLAVQVMPGEEDEDPFVFAGTQWSHAQVLHMRTIIGLAKTMFPEADREAAIIGLITARVESGFTNYANDGVLDENDPNPGPYTARDYEILAHSMHLGVHEAVGSDHASLGVMQQQVTMGWGDFQEETWSGDDEAKKTVIRRLMTPSFAVGKFFTKLAAVDGWEGMEPGSVAQAIQISALPDAYTSHVALATQIWDGLSVTSPALAVPLATGWLGTLVTDPESLGESGCLGGNMLINGYFSWPVDMREDGSPEGYISSQYGWRRSPSGSGAFQFHHGLDLTGLGYGSGVYAAAGGVVVRSQLFSVECGEFVKIAHSDGTATGYLHQVDRLVQVGDTVVAGQKIGNMGGTQPGECTFGGHVHMSAYDQQGNSFDPEIWLAERGMVFPAERILPRRTG